MKAQDMFKELGFNYEKEDMLIRYLRYIELDNRMEYIEFYISDNDCVLSSVDNHLKTYMGFVIDSKLVVAITQQMKELGWV